MKIRASYFLKEYAKIFGLFLFCFYGVYILVDYASHTTALFQHPHFSWKSVALYYFYTFASRAEILIPLALLIACVKTVSTLNHQRELLAFMAGGISLQTLLRPFLCIGIASMLLLYANEEWVLPSALKKLRRIEEVSKQKKSRSREGMTVQHLVLKDGSPLLFQKYDSTKEEFFDLFWIQSFDSVYRIKYLSPWKEVPEGRFVDHFVRSPSGELLQQEAYLHYSFKEMKFDEGILQSALLDPEMASLSDLWRQLPADSTELSEKESKLLTAFHWKLAIPLLCLLSILVPAPYCTYFSRQMPLFFIYVATLFGLIAFYMLMDATQVVARRQLLPPFWAIWTPMMLLLSFFGYRYIRIK